MITPFKGQKRLGGPSAMKSEILIVKETKIIVKMRYPKNYFIFKSCDEIHLVTDDVKFRNTFIYVIININIIILLYLS